MTRPPAPKSARTAAAEPAGGGVGSDSVSVPSVSSAVTPRHPRPREPPQLERAVVSRTRFHITLPVPPSSGPGKISVPSEGDQRGWSSPHGEPYRPLGRPELNLKFSPQLVYGVSPILQNAHRVRVLEGGGGAGGATRAGDSDKDKELRDPSSCTATASSNTSITTLVDQFVASLTSRKRPLDERQVKLAHRLQANVGGFSPEKVRGLLHRKPHAQEQEGHDDAAGQHQQRYQTSDGDTSFKLLREAIEEGSSRLRSTRNGTNFLQEVPPSDINGLHSLHEQYLRARLERPGNGSVSGVKTNSHMHIGQRATHDVTTRHTSQFKNRDEDVSLDSMESGDNQGTWYLPYTTRQLQRSPHRRLPSLREFRLQARDDKQPSRPLRASSNFKTSQHKVQTSVSRFNHASLASARGSTAPTFGVLNAVGESNEGDVQLATVISPFSNKVAVSPFAVTNTFAQLPSASVAPLHSIEKLQRAVDALEATKSQQSIRLTTALEMLEQDRRECFAGKFCNLRVQCDATEDLRQMRERSERCRGQRVLAVVTKTADWYPDLLRRLLARECVNLSSTGTGNPNSNGLAGPHAAELFIAQAIRHIANGGCEFQSKQLFQVVLYLHHDDLELLHVQQLLIFLRNALRIDRDEWTRFFAAHGLSEILS